jgi:uncharacterized protein YbjT (DUF2867 family)
MRILVTGATGYVGSRLITELPSQGHEVVATSRNVDRLAEFGWNGDVTAVAAAADADRVPAGAYNIFGPESTTYSDLLGAYGRATGKWRLVCRSVEWIPAWRRC